VRVHPEGVEAVKLESQRKGIGAVRREFALDPDFVAKGGYVVKIAWTRAES
jgi:hypothetical protein